MSLSLRPTQAAIATNLTLPFSGFGGVEPYVYSVLPDGAGGTINSSTGVYSSPSDTGVDIVQVMDASGSTSTVNVLIGTPLELVCDIIQTEMSLDNGRVYLWDQKIDQPTDFGLYIAVGVLSCKPFSNTNKFVNGTEVQSINMSNILSVDIISRDTSAVYRKEEILMALNSSYAEQQQSLNSFRIFPITTSFVNLSQSDGSAIPYRFNLSVGIQYFVTKTKAIEYYNDFATVEVTTEP